ncbi:MAG: hypothetical protein CL930_08040 [Deltaproteobacteria bacterium]|nr:hypothetical protein [Deltaproteobacteria bacterium]
MTWPDVHNYLDYRIFLSDWLQWKKEASPRFSHRGFVRRVGQKSPSLLVDIVAGRRSMTPDMITSFAKEMKLKVEAKQFLELLIDLDKAGTPEKRNRVWERISARKRFQEAHAIEGDSFRYLSDWSYPAIRELALRPDFQRDAGWVSAMLRPRISKAHAQRALDALFELGMLVESESGEVCQADGAVVTPREVLGLAVHNYHQGMIERARDGIVNFKAAERHYTGVTVCIPEALVPRIKDEINAFAERLLELCDGAEETAERVYQFHLMAFPLSGGKEEEA